MLSIVHVKYNNIIKDTQKRLDRLQKYPATAKRKNIEAELEAKLTQLKIDLHNYLYPDEPR